MKQPICGECRTRIDVMCVEVESGILCVPCYEAALADRARVRAKLAAAKAPGVRQEAGAAPGKAAAAKAPPRRATAARRR